MNLTRLAGNAPLKRQLELETARRGLSHAYILSGPAGSGKRTLAGLLAAALVAFLRDLSVKNRRLFREAWGAMWGIAALSLVLLFAAGFITSFLELFLVIGTCGFLRHVERILLRQRSRISGH